MGSAFALAGLTGLVFLTRWRRTVRLLVWPCADGTTMVPSERAIMAITKIVNDFKIGLLVFGGVATVRGAQRTLAKGLGWGEAHPAHTSAGRLTVTKQPAGE